MFDRLTALLGTAGVDLSTDELLDVLWLATVGGDGEPDAGTSSVRPAERHPAPGAMDDVEDASALNVEYGEPGSTGEDPSAPPSPGLYAPPGPGDRGRPSRSVGVQGVRALRSPRALGRALRPLRRTVASRTAVVLDEDATVDRMAETGLPEPVLRPVPERWLTAALVVDDGPSMVLWRQLADEVRCLLQGQGIFQDIRTYTMDSGEGTGPLVRSSAAGARGGGIGVLRMDPTRPTLVLVLSDMVGERWRDGTIPAALRTWALRASVAVLQPLPERMWTQAAGPVERLLARGPQPASPGSLLAVSHPVLPDGLTSYSGTVVPVLELTAGHLAPWASLLATGRSRSPLPVLLVPDSIPQPPVVPTPRASETPSAQERFRRFREAASPESSQLAAALASVTPLTLPVMRLVHEAHRGDGARFHPAQLAEVFLGGLLRRRDTGGTARAAECVEHEFHPGVADLLLDTVRTSVALDTAERVSGYLLGRGGQGPEFRARLDGDGPGATPDLPEDAGPFAAASPQLLRRLGLPGGAPPEPVRSGEPEGPEAVAALVSDQLEDPVERFVMTQIVPPLVAFAEQVRDDPTVPERVRRQAGRVVRHADVWVGGYGWDSVRGLNHLAKALTDFRQDAYAGDLARLVRVAADRLTDDTDLVTRNMRGLLAIGLSSLGETAAAVPHLRRVIELSRVEHGPLHQYTLNARAFLHEMLYDAGWLKEAEADGRALLKDFAEAGERDDRRTWADFVKHQAFTLYRLGQWGEAEELLHSVLAASEGDASAALSSGQRLVARSWLASALKAQGRYAEAERELRSALLAAEGGPTEETGGGRVLLLDTLADLLDETDRTGEAEDLRRTVIEISGELYGADHPRTLRARHDWLRERRSPEHLAERLSEVEELKLHAVDALGTRHGVTLQVRHLSHLLRAEMEDYDASLEMQRVLLDLMTGLLGAGHRAVLVLRHDYGMTLRRAGRHEQAEKWLRLLLREETERLEPTDSLLSYTSIAVARSLAALDRPAEALAVCRELLEQQLRTLPEGSVRTAATHRRIAQLLSEAGAYEEAVEHRYADWAAYRNALGEEAPGSLSVGHQYGALLHRAGRHQEAVEVLESVAVARARVLGPSDRGTLRSRMWLGDALAAVGDPGAAERARVEWAAVRETAVREWGDDDELARSAARRSEPKNLSRQADPGAEEPSP
ncbi:SAV_2336 N-terminal domain-related protein [Streptomyces rubiginosohelvolus]|uniref:SAV_2336 N-terminal domain-related protein n=1 Tax=Streptomyces rubiginosohelvolus TaxID=67362 RepID=UPI0036B4919D